MAQPVYSRKRVWAQQPQKAAQIDWSHPLVIAAKIKYVVVTGGFGLATSTIFQKSKALPLPTRCGLVTPIGVSSLYTGGDASILTGTAGFANNSRSMFALIHGGITASSYDYCRMTQASGGQIEYNHGNITFSVRTYNGTFTTPAVGKTGQLRVWGIWDQPNNVGTLYVPGNTPVTVGTTSTWDINNDLVGVFNGADQASLLLGFYCEGVVQKGVMDALSSNPWQIFHAPDQRIWIPSVVVTLPTLGRAIADTSSGLWTPSTGLTLFGCVDELTPDAGDYITVTAASTCELALNETAFPLGAAQTLSYRASSLYGSTLTVTIKQGATVVASWSHALTASDMLYTHTLTAPQSALIAAGALSVQMSAS